MPQKQTGASTRTRIVNAITARMAFDERESSPGIPPFYPPDTHKAQTAPLFDFPWMTPILQQHETDTRMQAKAKLKRSHMNWIVLGLSPFFFPSEPKKSFAACAARAATSAVAAPRLRGSITSTVPQPGRL